MSCSQMPLSTGMKSFNYLGEQNGAGDEAVGHKMHLIRVDLRDPQTPNISI